MSFLVPQAFLLLTLLPALAAAFFAWRRRSRRRAAAYPGLFPARGRGAASRPLDRLPGVALTAALLLLIVAVARPVVVLIEPGKVRTVVLAIDTSLSMLARDVKPTRLVAATSAARAFIETLPPDVQVAIVQFAGRASLLQSVTRHHAQAIESLRYLFAEPGGTAIGSGIVASLSAIMPDSDVMRPAGDSAAAGTSPAAGFDDNGCVVVLSDGESQRGVSPARAAGIAAQWGVRVYTVGVGTEAGSTLEIDGQAVHVKLDERSLKWIAQSTGGEYFNARNAEDLVNVYAHLAGRFEHKPKETEVTALFAAAAAALLLSGSTLSLLRRGRVL